MFDKKSKYPTFSPQFTKDKAVFEQFNDGFENKMYLFISSYHLNLTGRDYEDTIDRIGQKSMTRNKKKEKN